MTDSPLPLPRLPNEIGGVAAGPFQRTDHALEPWEKRRGVAALGAGLVGALTYYERWVAAFAVSLFQKWVLTLEILARKMDEVAARAAVLAE